MRTIRTLAAALATGVATGYAWGIIEAGNEPAQVVMAMAGIAGGIWVVKQITDKLELIRRIERIQAAQRAECVRRRNLAYEESERQLREMERAAHRLVLFDVRPKAKVINMTYFMNCKDGQRAGREAVKVMVK